MTPIRFVYFDEDANQKVRLTIHSQFQQYFTKEIMYRVLLEYEDGFVMEPILPEVDIHELLNKRIKE